MNQEIVPVEPVTTKLETPEGPVEPVTTNLETSEGLGASSVAPDTREKDPSKAWDLAYDEKYKREGKTEFLEKPNSIVLYGTKAAAIDYLYNAYKDGRHECTMVGNDIVTSRDVGEMGRDRFYEMTFGCNRENYRNLERLRIAARNAKEEYLDLKEKLEAISKLPELIKKSAGLIKPDMQDKWPDFLEDRARGTYHGVDSEYAVSLMVAHSEGASQAELKKMFEELGSVEMVLNIITLFYNDSESLLAMLRGSGLN